MKNSKTRRILLLLGCAVLLVCLSVGATLAYLTSQTDTVVNTFTVGNVQIKLDETDVDLYGKKDSEDRVMANDYKLLPGHTYTKDPTVTVLAKSEDCYVRVFVTITDSADVDDIFKNYELTDKLESIVLGRDSKWAVKNVKEDTTKDIRVYELRYTEIVPYSETATKLPAVFTSIKIPDAIENADLATLSEMQIKVVAQAIQADGFTKADGSPDPDAAWAAFEAQ
ncbi:MAG: SipW-dependent-type signal peptide-containing protein [Aristaeellaceae bacterium]